MRIARHIVSMDRKRLTHEYLFPASIYAVSILYNLSNLTNFYW